MSYLTLAKEIPGFSKAVISFWFRIPQASWDAAAAARTGKAGALLDGIVPLVVMGKRGTGETPLQQKYPYPEPGDKVTEYLTSYNYIAGPFTLNLQFISEDLGGGVTKNTAFQNLECSWSPLPQNPLHAETEINPWIQTGAAPPTNPTFIGVDSSGILYINFESTKKPSAFNYLWNEIGIAPGTEINGISNYGGLAQYSPGNPFASDPYDSSQFWFMQGSRVTMFGGPHGSGGTEVSNDLHKVYAPGGHTIEKPQAINQDISDLAFSTGAIISDVINITPDEWHHLLVSVELKTVAVHGIGDINQPANFEAKGYAQYTDSAAKLYVALDDKNYLGWNLSSCWNWNGNPGTYNNEIITHDATLVAGHYLDKDRYGEPLGTPNYSVELEVPAGKVGLPGTGDAVSQIHRVEMAEFQMWTGVTLDTGVVNNRRAFVSAEGKPVSPTKPANPDDPDDKRTAAEMLLGKKPELLLHGSSNWKQGYNTGTTGITIKTGPDGKDQIVKIPDGQFARVAVIEKYTPDPSL